jgi:hypothetical protein
MEIELLDALLDETPPCEILRGTIYVNDYNEVMRKDLKPCGLPSVARIRYYCSCWTSPKYHFTCQRCIDAIQNGDLRMKCSKCYNQDFEWKAS